MATIEVLKDEVPQMQITAESVEAAAKQLQGLLGLTDVHTKGGADSLAMVLPDLTIYRLTLSKKASRASGPRAPRKSKEPEYVANQVYVQAEPVNVAGVTKWAFITRLKADDGDIKAGKAVKLIEALRIAIYREVGKGQFYGNSYTDSVGKVLNEPRWVVADSRKADVVAKLAEAGIEVLESQ